MISDGAKSDLANVLGLFDVDNTVLVPDPVYPTYVDDNVTDGRKIIYGRTYGQENGFLGMPDDSVKADIIVHPQTRQPGRVHDLRPRAAQGLGGLRQKEQRRYPGTMPPTSASSPIPHWARASLRWRVPASARVEICLLLQDRRLHRRQTAAATPVPCPTSWSARA